MNNACARSYRNFSGVFGVLRNVPKQSSASEILSGSKRKSAAKKRIYGTQKNLNQSRNSISAGKY